MKIVKKTVQVVIIANSTLDPQVNGIYYLANPGNGFNSFFSKDGGNSYPRILYDNEHQEEYPYVIQVAPGSVIYYGVDSNPAGWPGVSDFNNAAWYNDGDGNAANINTSPSTADRAYVYKTGNTVFVSYNMNATILGDIIP